MWREREKIGNVDKYGKNYFKNMNRFFACFRAQSSCQMDERRQINFNFD